MERVVLVGAPLKSLREGIAKEHLDELTRLTDTAGGQVVDIVRQRIDAPHPRFYVGKGKVFADTNGIHRGGKAISGHRNTIYVRFSADSAYDCRANELEIEHPEGYDELCPAARWAVDIWRD